MIYKILYKQDYNSFINNEIEYLQNDMEIIKSLRPISYIESYIRSAIGKDIKIEYNSHYMNNIVPSQAKHKINNYVLYGEFVDLNQEVDYIYFVDNLLSKMEELLTILKNAQHTNDVTEVLISNNYCGGVYE